MIDYSQIELKTMSMVETVIQFIGTYMYTRKKHAIAQLLALFQRIPVACESPPGQRNIQNQVKLNKGSSSAAFRVCTLARI